MTANPCLRLNDKTRALQLKRETENHSIQGSSTKRHKEALIEEQSSTSSFCDLLHISATTETSKVVVKKYTPEQHQVHIHSKQSEAAFELDHVMQDLCEGPSQVIVDEENCKSSLAISTSVLEQDLTNDEDATVKQNASGQNQWIDNDNNNNNNTSYIEHLSITMISAL